MLDHVANLSLHGDEEQSDEVHDENRPEDGYVEDLEAGADERDDERLECGVPELELGQTAHERPELFVGLGRQLWLLVVLVLEVVDHDRREEQYELIEQKDAHDVGDYVEALEAHHSVHEEDEEDGVEQPPEDVMRCDLVQYALESKREARIEAAE